MLAGVQCTGAAALALCSPGIGPPTVHRQGCAVVVASEWHEQRSRPVRLYPRP